MKNTQETKQSKSSKKQGQFTKGDPRINRTGLNKGTGKEKSFIEFYDTICEDIAKKNNMSVDEVKEVIYKVGYAKAKEGNYQFYKDILDRIHGQATANTKSEHTLSVDLLGLLKKADESKEN